MVLGYSVTLRRVDAASVWKAAETHLKLSQWKYYDERVFGNAVHDTVVVIDDDYSENLQHRPVLHQNSSDPQKTKCVVTTRLPAIGKTVL